MKSGDPCADVTFEAMERRLGLKLPGLRRDKSMMVGDWATRVIVANADRMKVCFGRDLKVATAYAQNDNGDQLIICLDEVNGAYVCSRFIGTPHVEWVNGQTTTNRQPAEFAATDFDAILPVVNCTDPGATFLSEWKSVDEGAKPDPYLFAFSHAAQLTWRSVDDQTLRGNLFTACGEDITVDLVREKGISITVDLAKSTRGNGSILSVKDFRTERLEDGRANFFALNYIACAAEGEEAF